MSLHLGHFRIFVLSTAISKPRWWIYCSTFLKVWHFSKYKVEGEKRHSYLRGSLWELKNLIMKHFELCLVIPDASFPGTNPNLRLQYWDPWPINLAFSQPCSGPLWLHSPVLETSLTTLPFPLMYGKLENAPLTPRYPLKSLELMNVALFGKRVFTDVIKSRTLRWDHPGLSGWVLNQMTSVLTKDTQKTEEEEAM